MIAPIKKKDISINDVIIVVRLMCSGDSLNTSYKRGKVYSIENGGIHLHATHEGTVRVFDAPKSIYANVDSNDKLYKVTD